jgi:excisionase family DNA binding protein
MQQKQAARETDTATNSIRLRGLSPAAAAFVRKHPGQAQLAVMAALEAAATQFGALDRVEPTIPEKLRPFVIEAAAVIPPIGVIGADEAAQRLGVTRATIYNWIEAKRLIGWSLTRLGKMIPMEQIAGKGEVVAGIDRVLGLIPEPRAAWRFLDEVSPHFDTPQRPIDVLKAGKLDQVLNAARASGAAFT